MYVFWPRPLRFYFGGNCLMFVVFCGVIIGVENACVLLGSIWHVVIVFTGCIRESSVFVCWPKVFMLVVYIKWNDRMYFLA